MSQEISKININNNTYSLKDATARAEVEALETKVDTKITDEMNGQVSNALDFVQGLKINGATVTCENDLVTFE